MLLDSSPSHILQIYDIQKSTNILDLRSCVLSGLQETPKWMPSLLLWDEQGLKNFDTWTKSPAYYPKRCEWEILSNHKHDIVRCLPEKSLLIELGCGSLQKTATILSVFEKEQREVCYYALDVSEDALCNNLATLKESFAGSPFITISGLSGTYDDCAEWLSSSLPLSFSTIAFLWLGNSIANLSQTEASNLLRRFCQACQNISIECCFLVSVDCCTTEERLLNAYDPNGGSSRKFLFHGIHHANRLLGQRVFNEDEWDCIVDYDRKQNELHFSYAPKLDVEVSVGQSQITLLKDQKIHFFLSGKWSEVQVRSIAEASGFKIGNTWTASGNDYCFYLLNSIA